MIIKSIGALLLSSFFSLPAIGFGLGNTGSNKIPTIGDKAEKVFEENNVYYIGDTSKKDIYLTFDTGYENGYTPLILDVLKKTDTKAAFFVTGHFLKEEDLILRMKNEGHIVGNHSMTHPDFTNISKEKVTDELKQVEDRYKSITGTDIDKFIRPPRGTYSESSLKYTNELGYKTVFWSLAFVDWHIDKQKGWEYSYNNIMDRIHNGSVILLHTVSKDNAYALENVINDLKTEGYTFKTLYDLTNL